MDIVLVSNASMSIYSDNKLYDFKVRLPVPLQFDASYKVAVTRISFTKSYFNFDPLMAQRKYWIILSDNKQRYEPDSKSRNECRVMGFLLPGYYTPQTFIEMVNKCATDMLIAGTDKLKTSPLYNLKNNYANVVPGTFVNENGHNIRFELDFDPFVKAILGVDKPDTIRPVFLNQGYTDLLVYSDIVYPSIVGDRHCDLLAILDGQTEKDYGAHCCETFETPWWHELSKHSFQTIRIYIKTDTGMTPNFRFGRVSLRLSFKKDE